MDVGKPLKPKALHPGDTIGIISPSWFGGPEFVPRATRGIHLLEAMGYKVKTGDHAFNNRGFVSDSVENRLSDLHAMFADDKIQAIISTIGGDHSCHLLPHIDWNLIKANPKIFMGFSDITVLNIAIWSQTGLVTFNGPTLLTDWAEYPAMPKFSRESALRMLTDPLPFGPLQTSPEWTDERLSWETGEDLTRGRIHIAGEGWKWLKPGSATGTLMGGCLESLQHLRGTRFWPNLEGAILFVETSESCLSPEDADALLMDFENMGVFGQISGLLVARPYGMTPDQHQDFWRIVGERTREFDFPVVGDMDFGHTSPQMTIPVGVMAQIDNDAQTVEIIKGAVTAGS